MEIVVIGFSVPQTSDCGIKIFYSKYKYETSSSIFRASQARLPYENLSPHDGKLL